MKVSHDRRLFQALIDYFYLDNVELIDDIMRNPSDAVEMFHLANTYAPSLKSYCEQSLSEQISRNINIPMLNNSLSADFKGLLYLPTGQVLIPSPAVYQEMLSNSTTITLESQCSKCSETNSGTCVCKESFIQRMNKPLGNDLLTALNDPTFSDAILKVGSRMIYCHRVILASRSHYF